MSDLPPPTPRDQPPPGPPPPPPGSGPVPPGQPTDAAWGGGYGGGYGQGGPPPPPAPPAGLPRLREMSLGEILDASLKLYQGNWQVFMGIVAAVVVPLQVVLTGMVLTELWILIAISQIITGLLLSPLMSGAVAKAAGDVYLGHTPDIGDTYRFTVRHLGSLLGAFLLITLGTILGLLALIIPGIILMVRWYFASIVVVLEGRKATDAMRRSFQLTKGSFWRLVGAAVVVFLLSGIIGGVVGVVVLAVDSVIVDAIGDAITQIIVVPFGAIVSVLLYFDLRVRREAFDLDLLAQELGSSAGELPPPSY